MRFHRVTVVGVTILSSVLVLTGIFSGSNPQVFAGVFAMVGLWIWATRFPSKPIAFRLLHLLLYRLVLAVAAALLASVVISAVLALVDGDLPTTLASTYLGAGIVYCVVAITGCVITARKLSGASRENPAQ
jgi:predicted Co/Zn/Cd cation transporter (cation efflux family)